MVLPPLLKKKGEPVSYSLRGLIPVTLDVAILSSLSPGHYLLVVAVSQDPVFLLRVKEETEDVESEAVFLIGRPLVQANEQAALHLRVRK